MPVGWSGEYVDVMKVSPRTTIAVVACVGALVFSACGGDDDTAVDPATSADTEPSPTAATTGDTADPTATTDSPATTATTSTGAATTDDAAATTDTADDAAPTTAAATTTSVTATAEVWQMAIDTAESEAGGSAYELDDQDDDGTWQVDVAVDDRSVEVTVSADGTQVVGTEDDDLDDDDRQALAAATITLADAITTALAEVPGTLDDAEIDADDGTVAWQVTVDVTPDVADVYVDVATGAVLRVERD